MSMREKAGDFTEKTVWKLSEVRRQLEENAEDEFRRFTGSLMPGTQRVLGVRVPVLRAMAKNIARGDYEGYLEESRLLTGEDLQVSHEELMLQGLVLGAIRIDDQRRMQELNWFVPKIHNWAVCDCCCASYKWMAKDRKFWYPWLLRWLEGEREYEIRFTVVSLLDHFVTQEYIDRILQVFREINHPGYYVKMAVAWALSVCYVKFPRQTEELLREQILDPFTQNKTIQKIRESLRVTKEQKDYLRRFRIEEKKEKQQ